MNCISCIKCFALRCLIIDHFYCYFTESRQHHFFPLPLGSTGSMLPKFGRSHKSLGIWLKGRAPLSRSG